MIMPQLIEFLNEHQRDPRLNQMLFPPYNERRCIEIINIHETNEEYKAASEIYTIYIEYTSYRYRSGICIYIYPM